jgi:hypothetical protein
MNEAIQELLAKYRRQQEGALRKIHDPLGDTQTPSFRNGQLDILDRVVEDLREVVLNDNRCGV